MLQVKYEIDGAEPQFVEEHLYGDSFWISPIRIKPLRDSVIRMHDVQELDEISVPSRFVDPFLLPLFISVFKSDREINSKRVGYEDEDHVELVRGFDCNLTYNFFTYDDVNELLKQMYRYADALIVEDLNEIDDKTGARIEKNYTENMSDLRKADYYAVISGFYRTLAHRVEKMMKDFPDAYLSVMGP